MSVYVIEGIRFSNEPTNSPPPVPPPKPTQYLSIEAVAQQILLNATTGNPASQDMLKTIVLDKFKANALLPKLEAAAVAYA